MSAPYSREKFYRVEQTIVHDNYDISVISESWLDPPHGE